MQLLFQSLPYIWKLFDQNSNLHLDGRGVLQENDVSYVADYAVQPGGAGFLNQATPRDLNESSGCRK